MINRQLDFFPPTLFSSTQLIAYFWSLFGCESLTRLQERIINCPDLEVENKLIIIDFYSLYFEKSAIMGKFCCLLEEERRSQNRKEEHINKENKEKCFLKSSS